MMRSSLRTAKRDTAILSLRASRLVSKMKQAFLQLGLGLIATLAVSLACTFTAQAVPPDEGEVEVTVDVPAVMALYLKKNAFTGPDWTASSITLTYDDYQFGSKELPFGGSPNPTGRVYWQSNTPAKITFELDPSGTFSSGGLQLWVKRQSVAYQQAVVGTQKLLGNAGATQLQNYQVSLDVRNITWANTQAGTYTESLVFTIQEL
jgi:hypothetical protein